MTDQTQQKTSYNLEACLEALLFVAGGSIPIGYLATTLECQQDIIEQGLHNLEQVYTSQERGLGLQWHNGRVQLTTSPLMAAYVENFLGYETTTRLTQAALETLAIIAYRQPITRPAIDSIRGVNSDGVLRSLLSKGLVQEIGRSEGPGRPILYGITPEFLQHFGLSSIEQLPPFENDEIENVIQQKNGLLKD